MSVPYVRWWINDWVGGTITMTPLERGCYMDLLMVQATTKAAFSEDTAKRVLGPYFEQVWPILLPKFHKTRVGHYFNPKMKEEIVRALSYSDSRRQNRSSGKTNKINTPTSVSDMGTGTGTDIGTASKSFTAFWKMYPKKVGKGAAIRAWSRLREPDKVLALIEKALKWQTTSSQWIRSKGQYIPHPATYVNQRRWEDEPHDTQPRRMTEAEAQEGAELYTKISSGEYTPEDIARYKELNQ